MANDPPFTIIRGEAKREGEGEGLPPGATIGILGGGQLGRMLAIAAAQLGYKCHIYSPEAESVAAEVSAHFTRAEWTDAEALAEFARGCDVVTWEFENVPVGPLAAIAGKLAPDPRALEVAQDRLAEKRFVEGLGGRPAPFAEVDSREDLETAMARIGTPGILKTRREGYDGKGQWRIASEHDAEGLNLHEGGFVYEGLVQFEAEFSKILVRGRDGEIRYWDCPENIHEDGILAKSILPASTPSASALIFESNYEAQELAEAIANALDYVGVLACEFFATSTGAVFFNEMAPRVHNSGHWTIEGAHASQFENHIRAICGLPLGNTGSVPLATGARIEMHNLIGDEALDVAPILADFTAHLHLYGKAEARPGRKMGHVTRIIP